MSKWIPCAKKLPPVGEEVLVLVDGHRRPDWSNTYQLVAYRDSNLLWAESTHLSSVIKGVFAWQPLPKKVTKDEMEKEKVK